MLDDTTMAVPALGMPVDGLGAVVRMAVRGAIEAAVQECGGGVTRRSRRGTHGIHGVSPGAVVVLAHDERDRADLQRVPASHEDAGGVSHAGGDGGVVIADFEKMGLFFVDAA